MLFDDQILFLHVPKTAGTSLTSYLAANLPRRVTLTEPSDKPDPRAALSTAARAKLALRRLRRRAGLLARPKLKIVPGTRHETLREAVASLNALGKSLEDFRLVLAVMRNPYDLEVSRYHFFRRGYQGIKGAAHEYAEELAQAGDFEAFARNAPYHGRLPSHIEDWYELDGRMPANLRLLRFEALEADLSRALDGIYSLNAPLPRLNASEHEAWSTYLTPASEEAIFIKYRWLFDRGHYPRARLA